MRLFVTGASGFIGSAAVPELIGAGHQVVGLARSDASAAALTAAGAEVHRGSLDDHDSLRAGAASAEGVIHLAYHHDFTDMALGARIDLAAIAAMGEVLEGSGKPLVVTSGTLALSYFDGAGSSSGGAKTEEGEASSALPRVASEVATLALAERGVRSSVVRLSPSVHGPGDQGFIPMLIAIARAKGVSAFVGDGANRWPAVHRLDAARLFTRAVEVAPAGSRLHGVGDTGLPFTDIAAAIGRNLDVPVVSISAADAEAHFGFLGLLVGLDNPTANALTQEWVGWRPEHPGLIEDLNAGHYFTV